MLTEEQRVAPFIHFLNVMQSWSLATRQTPVSRSPSHLADKWPPWLIRMVTLEPMIWAFARPGMNFLISLADSISPADEAPVPAARINVPHAAAMINFLTWIIPKSGLTPLRFSQPGSQFNLLKQLSLAVISGQQLCQTCGKDRSKMPHCNIIHN